MLKFVGAILLMLFVLRVGCVDEFLRGQSILYGLSSLTDTINTNTTCSEQLNRLYKEIDLKHFWALKVMDASGQPDTGFLWGNNLWIGSHFQCQEASNTKPLEVNYRKVKRPDKTPFDYPPFTVTFAMSYMRHNNTHQNHAQMPLENLIELGLCIPESCSREELQFFLQSYLTARYMHFQRLYDLNIEIEEVKILNSNSEPSLLSKPTTIVTLIVVITSVGLVIAGTIYDVNNRKESKHCKEKSAEKEKYDSLDQSSSLNSTSVTTLSSIVERKYPAINSKVDFPQEGDQRQQVDSNKANNAKEESVGGEIIRCFSIYSNIKALVKTRISSDSIGAIHGVRLFSMIWVIGVHTVYFQIDYLDSVAVGFRLSESFQMQILSNSTYVVDTFLFMSGFLISCGFYKSKSGKVGKKPVNGCLKVSEILMTFVYRYLRLTPVYAFTILLSDVLFSYYKKATVFYTTEIPDINCSKYWWRNLLYINNFYPRSEMCLSWSWYLSADLQFFLLASILLTLSTVAFKVSAFLVIILILSCMVTTGYVSYSIGYIPTMDEQFQQLDAIYDFPWNRIGPYLVGVIVGYILVVKLQNKLKLQKRFLALCWTIFPIINLWILFTIYGRQISVEFSAVYMGISRTLWGFGLGWLFVACVTGNAGIINKMLCFRGWIPLSRLTYCSYLINPLLISAIYLGTETAQTSSVAGFTVAIFGHCLLTFMASFLLCLLFESPYVLLTKMLYLKLVKKRSPTGNPA